MKFLNWVIKGSIVSVRVFYSLLAVVIILVAAYILGGYAFLVRGALGNDMGSALSMTVWADKYFPHVPFWYPLAGGGVSITHSYPVFSFYLVALLKRLTSLDLIQAFRVLGFSSVALMALGTYTFVALRFKNQTAALIASIFYLVSPIAWTWLFDWGFYAEAVSHMFVMPTIIFWDLFFTSFIDDAERVRNRIYLVLTVIFISLALLTHFGTGLCLMGFLGFYLIGYTIKTRERKRVFIRGILALSIVGILTLLLSSFLIFPFYRYTRIAAEAGVGGRSYEQLKQSEYTISHILGFHAFAKEEFLYATRHISFPAVISFFAIVGVLLSFQSARYLSLALFAIYALTLSINTDFVFVMLRYIPKFLIDAFTRRFPLVFLRFVLPTLAAFGVIGIFKIPLFWVKGRIIGIIKGVFVSLAGLTLVVFALHRFGDFPRPERFPYNFGPAGLDLRDIWQSGPRDLCLEENECLGDKDCLREFESGGKGEWCHSPLFSYLPPLAVQNWCQQANLKEVILPELCYPDQLTGEQVKSFWRKCKKDTHFSSLCSLRFKSLEEQLLPAGWLEFKVANSVPDPVGHLRQLEQILNRISHENPSARIDFSPYKSGLSMITPYYNVSRGLSQVHIYAGFSSLILRFWGDQSAAFYLNSPYYGENPDLINNFARQFGINYIFFDRTTDTQLFQKAGWEVWDGSWEDGILKFPEENPLAELSEKPAVLVISQKSLDAYDQVFRLSSYGVIPYKDAFVVWGKGMIDDYSLKELRQFDVLLLHGYTYKSWQKANKLLSEYVRGGGNVFIDTGWQYTVPDWETESALEIIPFKKLSWKDLGKTSDFVLEDIEIVKEMDVSQFGPLIYKDQPWRVSTSEKSDLKDWARVALSVKDYPLIVVGKFGQGRVVWSGMNIFPHAKQGENIYYEELELLANLFSWLTEGKPKINFPVTYKREHPDKVEFIIEEDVPNGSFLLWKEAYYPDFRAFLISNLKPQTLDLDIYRAGPGLVAIKLPQLNRGDRIVYEYRQPLSEKISSYLSLLTLLFLPVIIAEGFFLRGRVVRRVITIFCASLRKKFIKPLINFWEKEDEV